jgi:hypothetical protein
MLKSIYQMTIAQLAQRGWTIIHETDTGKPTAIRTVIDQWRALTWAKQTYCRAKYGFDEDGVLEISLHELHPTPRIAFRFHWDLFPDEFVTPGGQIPGSNDRLREILERSRLEVDNRKYDDTALVHTGPDGSLILTNEVGWGPPYTERDSNYVELDEAYTCYWESGPSWVPEAPCWTCPACNEL